MTLGKGCVRCARGARLGFMSVQSIRERYRARWKTADENEMAERGTFITQAGRFRAEIVSAELRNCYDKEKLNRGVKEKNWQAFICKFKILRSDNSTYPVGSTAAWFVKDPKGTKAADVERLMWSLQGHNPGTVKILRDANPAEYERFRLLAGLWSDAAYGEAEALEFLEFDPGFLAGLEVELETYLVDTKPQPGRGAGKFTVHVWAPTTESAASPIDLLPEDGA